jgi:hypothetical protein
VYSILIYLMAYNSTEVSFVLDIQECLSSFIRVCILTEPQDPQSHAVYIHKIRKQTLRGPYQYSVQNAITLGGQYTIPTRYPSSGSTSDSLRVYDISLGLLVDKVVRSNRERIALGVNKSSSSVP